jgi:hypothetical protein
MEKYLSLSEIKMYVNDMASRINVDMGKHFAYSYGYPENLYEYPYVEVHKDGYCFIVKDRGQITVEKHTQDIQELLYWIFEFVTFDIALDFAVKHPFPASWQQRRIMWKKQLELLNTISPGFKEQRRRDITEILAKNPANDGLPNNMDYEEWERE